MKRLLIIIFLALVIVTFPSYASRPRYFYLLQPGQDKIVVLDGEQAEVAATVQAKLGEFNVPFRAGDGQGPLLVYSRKERTGDQWVSVTDAAGGQSTRQVDLGEIPDGLSNKAVQWILASDSVTFFGNKGGEGAIFVANLRTGEFRTTNVGAKITDAVVGANGHLYLGKGASSKYELCEYTGPDLVLARSVPLSHRPASIVRQGQDIVVLEALPDLLAAAMKVALATQSIFVFGKDSKYLMQRYDLNLTAIAGPEELGRAAWFWHPKLEVLMVASMYYKGPRTQGKYQGPVMLLYGPDGRCEAVPSAFFDLFAFDPSLNNFYFGGIAGGKPAIIEINLSDFSRRSAEQRGFGIVINDKPMIQGFMAAYGGGSGITFYNNPSKVAVLDFTRGLSHDFECDTGAGFGASFGYWLLLREESAVVYIPGRSQVVTYNNKAQKINVFGFPDGSLIKAIPFKAKDVVLIDNGDGRRVLVRTPGQWQVLDLDDMGLQPFLEEDDGHNQDTIYISRQLDQRTLYVLREQVCYLVDPSTLSILARIPLTDVKYDKEGELSLGPRFSL